jgi:purine-nucleoside phosphorylase
MQNFEEVQSVVQALRLRLSCETGQSAPLGVILGTGLSAVTEGLRDCFVESRAVPWEDLPGFPLAGADSHKGFFIWGHFKDDGLETPVLIQQGRCHLYEGKTVAQVCMGVRALAGFGVKNLIVTNAAGALNPRFESGSLMCMADQINHTGVSPLTGPNCDGWGERFPDMGAIFDAELQTLALAAAADLKIRLERGVYIGVHGPELESPAETRMYRQWGADAIGMSSVLEVIAARHLGMRVLGISCLTNKNLPDCMLPVSLDEIIAVAGRAGEKLALLLRKLIPALCA